MRETKFRAYYQSKWRIVCSLTFHRQKLAWLTLEGVDGSVSALLVKLAQYTGLKDKNGIEIYEGDMVRHYDYPWLKAGGQSVVEWQGDACGFRPFIQGNERYGRPLAGEWIEVIGNIYEKKVINCGHKTGGHNES